MDNHLLDRRLVWRQDVNLAIIQMRYCGIGSVLKWYMEFKTIDDVLKVIISNLIVLLYNLLFRHNSPNCSVWAKGAVCLILNIKSNCQSLTHVFNSLQSIDYSQSASTESNDEHSTLSMNTDEVETAEVTTTSIRNEVIVETYLLYHIISMLLMRNDIINNKYYELLWCMLYLGWPISNTFWIVLFHV